VQRAALIKRWRDLHPVGQALAVCFVLILACVFWVLSYAAYMKNEPDLNEATKTLQSIQQGRVKPDSSGRVETEHYTVYLTRAAGGALTVLWPYNLAHDDNAFEGLLFSDTALTSNHVTALGPTRHGYPNAPSSLMTHLTVDRTISEHWYHVQGEMYK